MRKRLLLFIYEDAMGRAAIKKLLEGMFSVDEVAIEHEALQLFAGQTYDCVVMDEGVQPAAAKLLIAEFSKQCTPVIVLVNEEMVPEMAVFEHHVQDYLVKQALSARVAHRTIHNVVEQGVLRREVASQQQRVLRQARLLREKNKRLRQLASEMALTKQCERRRIAHILHDDVQQLIYAALAAVGMLRAGLAVEGSAALEQDWERLAGLLETAVETIRILSVELSPPSGTKDSLGSTLRFLAQQMKDLHQFDVELQLEAAPDKLSEDLTALIFQIVRELLFNIVKHAQVDRAFVEVVENDRVVRIRVVDHGVGFPSVERYGSLGRKRGFGLAAVGERVELFGGDMVIHSAPGRGSSIAITLPKQIRGASE